MKRKEKRSIFEFIQVTRKECTGLFLLQTSSQKSKTTSSNCVEINMTESVISLSVNDWQRKKESKLKSRKKVSSQTPTEPKVTGQSFRIDVRFLWREQIRAVHECNFRQWFLCLITKPPTLVVILTKAAKSLEKYNRGVTYAQGEMTDFTHSVWSYDSHGRRFDSSKKKSLSPPITYQLTTIKITILIIKNVHQALKKLTCMQCMKDLTEDS